MSNTQTATKIRSVDNAVTDNEYKAMVVALRHQNITPQPSGEGVKEAIGHLMSLGYPKCKAKRFITMAFKEVPCQVVIDA